MPPDDIVNHTASEDVRPIKFISKHHVIEYEYWIDERTMAFCLLPKESRYNHTVVRGSHSMSKVHTLVQKPDSEPKSSTTH